MLLPMGKSSDPAPTVSVAIGQAVRRRRLEAGLSQDEMAQQIRGTGLRWSSSVVAALENGRKKVDIGEAVLLARALDVSVADLIESDRIELAPGAITTGAVLRDALSGMVPAAEAERQRAAGRRAALVDAMAIQDSVVTLARRLRIPPEVVASGAVDLWDRGFLAERESRMAERGAPPFSPQDREQVATRQAIRGHVTREMYDELAEHLKHQPGALRDRDKVIELNAAELNAEAQRARKSRKKGVG